MAAVLGEQVRVLGVIECDPPARGARNFGWGEGVGGIGGDGDGERDEGEDDEEQREMGMHGAGEVAVEAGSTGSMGL